MLYIKRLICVILSVSILMVLAACSEEPEYMHPYGEGVDPDSVTTVPFQTRTTSTVTTVSEETTTFTTLTTVPTGVATVIIPEGHILCPFCQGVLVVCEKCLGTKKIKAEIFDEGSGVYVRKYIDCTDCTETPGYEMCEVCENKFYIEE